MLQHHAQCSGAPFPLTCRTAAWRWRKAGREPSSAPGIGVPFPSAGASSRSSTSAFPQGLQLPGGAAKGSRAGFLGGKLSCLSDQEPSEVQLVSLGISQLRLSWEKKKKTTKSKTNHSICAEIKQKPNPPRWRQQLKGDGQLEESQACLLPCYGPFAAGF